jgi:hypothetical protein
MNMDLPDIIAHLLLGIVFIIYGFSFLRGKSTRVGFGGGRSGGSPLFKVEFNGAISKFIGAVAVFGGLLFGLPSVLAIFGNYSQSSFIFYLPGIGIVIMIFCMFLALVIKTILSIGQKLKVIQENFAEHIRNNDT